VRNPYTFVVPALVALAAVFAAPIAAADSGNDPPVTQTTAPTAVTGLSAVLHGVIDDNGGHTVTYWFEIGTTTAYGTSTQRGTTSQSHTTVQRAIAGLAQGTTYHARLVASNEHGVSPGADTTFTTTGTADSPIPTPQAPAGLPGGDDGTGSDEHGAPALTAAAAPALGHSVALSSGAGTVLVRLSGSARPVALTDAASVPVGAIVDARRGSVELQSELPGGETQTGAFHGGVFEVRQPAGARGMTELVLRGPLPTCDAGGARAAATTSRRPPRGLWGRDDHGRFRTRGSNSVATVRGTAWYVADRCDGTLTRVSRGSVSVRDLRAGRTVTVRAGHSYLARGAAGR
jgi:hypothetical protein